MSSAVPAETKKLRACLLCSLVKTYAQFKKDGCENCEDILRMRGNTDKVIDCTSTLFSGTVSLMDPSDSWVGRWQRIDKFQPGIYAIQVSGRLADDVVMDLEDRGFSYFPHMAFANGQFESRLISHGRVDGEGSFTFLPDSDPIYRGKIVDGRFHGDGVLIFKDGTQFIAMWNMGKPENSRLIFGDQLEYFADNWKYCQEGNRQYQSEITHGISAACQFADIRNSK